MHKLTLGAIAATSAIFLVSAVGQAQTTVTQTRTTVVPYGSFITEPVQSRYTLVQHVQVDPVVSERYQRHFGMTHDEVVRYFSDLRTYRLEEDTTYTVWYTRPQTETVYSKQLTLRRGEPVFVDTQGTVVLRLKCGNPLITRTVAREYYNTYIAPTTTVATTTTTVQRAQPLVREVLLEPIVTQHNLSWEDAAAVYVLSETMDVQPASVVALRSPDLVSTSFVDLAPALMMSWRGERPVTDVWNMYNTGTPWMDIATQLAFPGNYYNPMALSTSGWSNGDFTNALWQTLLFDQLNLPVNQFSLFGTQNVPLGELLVATVIGNQLNLPAQDVLTAYAASRGDWSTVASNLIANPPIRSYLPISR